MRIVFDKTGEHFFETGTKYGVLYPQGTDGSYQEGVPWNGLISVTEKPGGAEANDMYADDIKYASLRSAETFEATIEAYTYPDEFEECDGTKEIAPGVYIGQQGRKSFGFCYRTAIGSDTDTSAENKYKLHLIYGATASPSEKGYQTINDSPDAITFSWDIETTPVNVEGYKPTASVVVNSSKVDATKLAQLESILYGSETSEPRLPLPDELAEIFSL